MARRFVIATSICGRLRGNNDSCLKWFRLMKESLCLCGDSLCLCGEFTPENTHHRDREIAQRHGDPFSGRLLKPGVNESGAKFLTTTFEARPTLRRLR